MTFSQRRSLFVKSGRAASAENVDDEIGFEGEVQNCVFAEEEDITAGVVIPPGTVDKRGTMAIGIVDEKVQQRTPPPAAAQQASGQRPQHVQQAHPAQQQPLPLEHQAHSQQSHVQQQPVQPPAATHQALSGGERVVSESPDAGAGVVGACTEEEGVSSVDGCAHADPNTATAESNQTSWHDLTFPDVGAGTAATEQLGAHGDGAATATEGEEGEAGSHCTPAMEHRCADDGVAYSFQEFQSFYGACAARRWKLAVATGRKPCSCKQPHGRGRYCGHCAGHLITIAR